MRILMVNKFVYPRAGAETYMLYVARCLQQDGHDVALFGMEHPENTVGEFPIYTCPRLEFGRNESAFTRVGQMGKALTLGLSGAAKRALHACLEDFKPDLIHAHNVYNQLPPSLFRGLPSPVPVIMTAHDYKPVCPNYSLFTEDDVCTRCLGGSYVNCVRYRCCQGKRVASLMAAGSAAWHDVRRTYRMDYDYFIAPSEFMRDRLVEGGFSSTRVRVINNFSHLPGEVTPPGQGLLYAGRLCREKGVDLLLEALTRIGSAAPPVTLAGEGPLEDELKAQAQRAGLNNIRWLGRISPEQVVEELTQCAVSIVPSRWYENCSMSIMESLAYGRPCVVSDSGGNSELIEDGITGWVFKRDTSDGLEQILRQLNTSADTLPDMGLRARAAAENRFSEPVHMKQLYEVYQEQLEAGNTA